MNPTNHIDTAVPILAGRYDLSPEAEAPHTYATGTTVDLSGEVTLLFEFRLDGYSFDPYCRFARVRGAGLPLTFTSLEFSENPPGIRVGPWPGWRGIPELPRFEASHGPARVFCQMMFWGDERSRGMLRGVARLDGEGDFRITVTSPDQRIVPERVSVYRTCAIRALPRPVTLRPELANVHPRLLVTPDDLTRLRASTTGSGRREWESMTGLLQFWDRPFEITPESKVRGEEERLSPEDRLLVSAFMAMMEPGEEQIGRGTATFREYLATTRQSDFEPLRIDTQSGEVLFLLCCAYDWLFPFLTDSEAGEARRRIGEISEICQKYLGEERRDYGQAHFLGCGLGLLAYAILFWEEESRARELAGRLRGALECALTLLPPDGSYAHGANLWIYEFGFLLRWIELIRVATGEDLWQERPALRHASDFRSWTLTPDGLFGIAFGDPQYRVGGDSWCHFLIAARTRSAGAQGLGEKLRDLSRDSVDFRNVPARRRVYEFLFHDPEILVEQPPAGLHHFADAGQITIRSVNTVFSIRSGPPLGGHRYRSGEYGGYGHADPCNGAYLLHRNGHFIASGPGPVYRRDTSLHNVATLNGEGQVGDSTVWLPDFIPPEVVPPLPQLRHEKDGVALSLELTAAYLPHLGITRYTRSLFVAVDAFVLGVDLVFCERPGFLEWNTHSWDRFDRISRRPDEFSLGGEARLILLSPENLPCETGLTEFVPAYPNDGRRDHFLTGRIEGRFLRVVWCYLFNEDPPPRIVEGAGEAFRVIFGEGRVIAFDGTWLTGRLPA